MNNRVLVVFLFAIAFICGIVAFPLGPAAALVGIVTCGAALLVINRDTENRSFLLRIFFIGLILRSSLALIINLLELEEFFGPDALYYDWLAYILSGYWLGDIPGSYIDLIKIRDTSQSGWGMSYIVATIYFFAGRNMLAAQLFCSVLGAATAPVTYLCSKQIFSNNRVAKISGWIVALCPSLIIWSSQMLKDGIIVFLLMTSILSVIHLEKKYSLSYFAIMIVSLMGILSLRFYIFYMLVVAIVGCFAVGRPLNPLTIVRRMIVLLFIGLALTSLGGTRNFTSDIENFNLDKVQQTRNDLARGNAGYAKDTDVSSTAGALTALPIGITYLMLAPFPWQMGNLRQAITLPEMILWWASMPFLIMGLIWSVKNRLRASVSVLLFTMMLTLAYSLYQGNVGSAYRQRAQIQVFHFMFIAVGYTLWREKQENSEMLKKMKKKK